jgi:hypothetical protein
MTDLQARAEAAADAALNTPFLDGSSPSVRSWMVQAALHALQSEGWRPISEAKVWVVCVVTDGKQVAIAQKALDDWGGEYWAVDPEDGLDWEPTLWMPHPYDAVLPAPPEEEGV